MKTVSIPVNKIRPNPYRDLRLFPIDKEQVGELKESIGEFGFFGGLMGRKVNGFIELGFGHSRLEALKRSGQTSVEMLIDDLDDDQMVALMVTENATQSGSRPAAIMNEVAAAMRRLVPIMLEMDFSTVVEKYGRSLFEGKAGFERARGKLLARIEDPDKDGGVGEPLIIQYLGTRRAQRMIRDAIKTLKQSGVYDTIVDDALAHAQQREFAKAPGKKASGTAVQPKKTTTPRKRIIDERCAAVFDNDWQFSAFKEAVTTEAAKRLLPVDNQLALAKEIVGTMEKQKADRKNLGAPFIKAYVGNQVQAAAKQQRDLDAQEKRKFAEEQIGGLIKTEIKTAKSAARSLMSSCLKLERLWQESPGHPMFGDIGGTLDHLAQAIEQLRKRFRSL